MRTWNRPTLVLFVVALIGVAAVPVNLVNMYLVTLHPLAYYLGWLLTIVAGLRLSRFDERWKAAG